VKGPSRDSSYNLAVYQLTGRRELRYPGDELILWKVVHNGHLPEKLDNHYSCLMGLTVYPLSFPGFRRVC
jgi:hypothetical protein